MKKTICCVITITILVLFFAIVIDRFDPIVCPTLDRVQFHDIWGSKCFTGKLMYSENNIKPDGSHLHMDDIPDSETYRSMLLCQYSVLPAFQARQIILSQKPKNTIAEFQITAGKKNPSIEATSYFSLDHLCFVEIKNVQYLIADYQNDLLYIANPIKESCWNISHPDKFAIAAMKKGASRGFTVVYQLDGYIVPLENMRCRSSFSEAIAVLKWNIKDNSIAVFYYSITIILLYFTGMFCLNKVFNRFQNGIKKTVRK